MSTETFWQKPSIFEESLNLCFFFILLSSVFPRGRQNCPYVSRGTFWGVLLDFFQLQVRTWAKNYRTFDYKALPPLSKQHSIGWEDHLWKSLFFLEFLQFHIFWPREKLFWYFWQKIINRFVRNVFCMSAGTVQEYHFSWEAFYLLVSFGLSATVFRTFAKKTSVKFVKAALNVWMEKVRREPFTFGKITTRFSAGFCRLFFHGVFKTACLVSRGNFWGDLLELFQL